MVIARTVNLDLEPSTMMLFGTVIFCPHTKDQLAEGEKKFTWPQFPRVLEGGTGAMAPLVGVYCFAWFPKFDAWRPHGERRDLIGTCYPLTSARLPPWLMLLAAVCTHKINKG